MPNAPNNPEPKFTDLAISDLHDIENYISQDNPQAARQLIERIREVCFTLAGQPYMGRSRPEILMDIRSFVVGNYIILYRPKIPSVEIVRVIHGSRNLHRLFQ